MTSAKKSSGKKTTKNVASTTKKSAVRKKANKVDYYPNRVSFWVSAAAGSVVVLWAVMIAYS
jgi:hypothetical protein